MTILITGGTGFTGSRAARKLAERGHQVVCFDVRPDRARVPMNDARVKVVQGDFSDFQQILASVLEHGVTRIIHLGYIRTQESERMPYAASVVNVAGTANVFEAARLARLERVVYASSVAVLGTQAFYGDRMVNEDDPPSPRGAYGAMKLVNELIAQRYSQLYGLSLAAIRPTAIFGHGARGTTGWWREFASQAALGQEVVTNYKADTVGVGIYVDDMAELFVRVCLADQLAHPVYISGGYTASPRQVADAILEYLPNARFSFLGQQEARGAYRFDDSRIRAQTGYQLPPMKERIKEHINEARREAGLEPTV